MPKQRSTGRTDKQVVYFIDCGYVTKIGIAHNPRSRLKALGTAHHEKLALWATMPGGRTAEQKLHGRMAEHRVKGEWYRLTESARADILNKIISSGGTLFDPPITSAKQKLPPADPPRSEYVWQIPYFVTPGFPEGWDSNPETNAQLAEDVRNGHAIMPGMPWDGPRRVKRSA